jgi:hypothetical protein
MSESDKKLIAIAGIPLEGAVSSCSTDTSGLEMKRYNSPSPKLQEAVYRWRSLTPKKD